MAQDEQFGVQAGAAAGEWSQPAEDPGRTRGTSAVPTRSITLQGQQRRAPLSPAQRPCKDIRTPQDAKVEVLPPLPRAA